MVGVPLLQVRVGNIVETLHLPLAEVDLHDARVALGFFVSTVVCQPRAAGEGTGVDMVERAVCFQRSLRGGCFFFKSLFQRHVGLPVTRARRHVNRGMADEDDFHCQKYLVISAPEKVSI